ncbi:MAG: DNA/RNA nuclease SfsA [Clostridia bacterium]|nr:DNA/RNA nuclease SfsA [Clostridia bacterium]
MKYKNIKEGVFISRPNRFIANVLIDREEHICHVKNTGRCRELLVKGARVFLEESNNPERKTKYDLVAVYKGERLINMDSQIPNKAFYEWVKKGKFIKDITYIKPEYKYGNSRFDFYIETQNEKILLEVKGVTLEENGVVMFPDAPTERGIKHIKELIKCKKEGFEAYIVFVVQMDNVKYFTPNRKTHKAFADALSEAEKCGVNIVCVNCKVTKDSMEINDFVEVRLNG